MSRHHRLLALSTSDDVAGTWKRISVASMSAPVPSIIPLRYHINPIVPNAQEEQDPAGGQEPPANILPFKVLHWYGVVWNE